MRPPQRDRLRRQAAERVLVELDRAPDTTAGPADPPGLAAETQAMRAITTLLTELSAEEWRPIPQPARTNRLTAHARVFAALAAVACIALGFAGGVLVQDARRAPASNSTPALTGGTSVTLRPLSSSAGQSRAIAYMPAPGQMLLHITHLTPSPAGTYYELWLMTDLRHLTPVAAFRIPNSGQATLSLRLPDNSTNYQYLDISRQLLGAGTAHSGDSILRGRLT